MNHQYCSVSQYIVKTKRKRKQHPPPPCDNIGKQTRNREKKNENNTAEKSALALASSSSLRCRYMFGPLIREALHFNLNRENGGHATVSHRIGGTVQSCHRLSFFFSWASSGFGVGKTSGWPQASFVAAVVAAVCVHLVRKGGRATIPAVWKIGSHVGIF
ncbi:hypothetical protein M441DRAFT_269685 [Trichoderma asperellum CBS 433.97]|uniref:Uncharacterized protein n=1 Tax=Trichoderma asperellum (strain ATCC 204424 / CBS 433.97 / NBRC 101777) TaxID=1042311 RepID=A0A2T3YW59_TRIA4|nr:hypothetical protein M441DRAFT_269685 [Trichoderma asperellum CBS 433.97]PTB36799.1 hypothetical protein M441DRAFT_269685 [Trichoderma asperellum CBS 433.97]